MSLRNIKMAPKAHWLLRKGIKVVWATLFLKILGLTSNRVETLEEIQASASQN